MGRGACLACVYTYVLGYSTCQTPQSVWPRGSGGQVPGSLPCSQSMHMAQSQELEAASKVVRDIPGWERWRQTCVRSTSVSHQGSRRHRTELPGAHSRKRLRHRQAPNDEVRIQTSEGFSATAYSTRNSAIADKPRDAFRGQSRSSNSVPFHMLGMVS